MIRPAARRLVELCGEGMREGCSVSRSSVPRKSFVEIGLYEQTFKHLRMAATVEISQLCMKELSSGMFMMTE